MAFVFTGQTASCAGGSAATTTSTVTVRAGCVVPRLKRKTLARARRLLQRHHCRLGKVRRPKASGHLHLVVVAQSPKAGSRRRAKARVSLTLGLGASLSRHRPLFMG